MTTKPAPSDKVQVNTRLYRVDVRLLRARAKEQGLPWQTLLRSLVHQHLHPKRSPKIA